jgi:hypothetical protein
VLTGLIAEKYETPTSRRADALACVNPAVSEAERVLELDNLAQR